MQYVILMLYADTAQSLPKSEGCSKGDIEIEEDVIIMTSLWIGDTSHPSLESSEISIISRMIVSSLHTRNEPTGQRDPRGWS